jgi:hypothetical protein
MGASVKDNGGVNEALGEAADDEKAAYVSWPHPGVNAVITPASTSLFRHGNATEGVDHDRWPTAAQPQEFNR